MMNERTHLLIQDFMKANVQIKTTHTTARTLRAQAAFEGLSTSELAENMILHCLTDDELLKRLVAECHAAKAQAKQAA
jgi:hypothetical protein